MKLSSHYNKVGIIVSVSVLFIGAVVYFIAINYISNNQLDRALREEIDELTDYVNLHKELPAAIDFDEYQTVITISTKKILARRYFDTLYNNPKENELEDGRAVESGITLKNIHYRVVITISQEGTEYLVQIIALITFILIIGLLLILFLTNRYVLNRLWKPFYDLLHQLKIYSVSENNTFGITKNHVDEFNELYKALNVMSLRIKNDFQNLKQFTENASHEMMTPLAVITSKLDTLIQDETLKSAQYDQITDIYGAAGKLSRLNQSLLLLVKIENNLVKDSEWLDLDLLISEKIRHFQELILSKEIQCIDNLKPKRIFASKYLVDILLNNIFSNAIRHNTNRGKIIITMTDDKVIFQNTGASKSLNAEKVFDRFQKGKKSEGTGLGLTIIKNICNLYNWDINYFYQDYIHNFQIIL